MATIKVIEDKPVAPPPKKYILELSLEEAAMIKSAINLLHCGDKNKKGKIVYDLWVVLNQANVPHYKYTQADPKSEQYLNPEDLI